LRPTWVCFPPAGQEGSSEEVLGTLLLGGTAGAVAGLALGKTLDLTEGQSLFATNVALLGLGTSLIVGTMMDRDEDGEVEDGQMTAMVAGIDGGAIGGLLLAPRIKWSRGRARFVGAATLVGTFLGGMIGGLIATKEEVDETGFESSTTDPDIAAASLLVGMWGGFAGGVALSTGWSPDKRYRNDLAPPAPAAPGATPTPTPPPAPAPAPSITIAPMVGDGRLGAFATGSF
jgi:hypothetical protein